MVAPDPAKNFVLADVPSAESGQIVSIGLEDQQQVADSAFRQIQRNGHLPAAHAGPDNRKNSLRTFKIREDMPFRLEIGDGGGYV